MPFDRSDYGPQSPSQNAATLAALPKRHGTQSDSNPSVRRRWNKKWRLEAEATVAAQAASPSTNSSIDPSVSAGVSRGGAGYAHHNTQSPFQRDSLILPGVARDVTVYHAHVDPSQFPQKSPRSAIPPQGHAPVQSSGEGHGTAQRRDSQESGRPSNPPSPPQHKPALSATSTSAEIVEALMPECPAPMRFPRRTVSVRDWQERRMATREVTLPLVLKRQV